MTVDGGGGRRRRWRGCRSGSGSIALLFQEPDDKVLVFLDEVVIKPLFGQEVAKVVSPVRIICLQLSKLGTRLVEAIRAGDRRGQV
jgi:hypothetical protein